MRPRQQKWETEIALQQRFAGILLFRAGMPIEEMPISPETRAVLNSATIYIICRKPRLRIIPESVTLNDEFLFVDIELYGKSERIVRTIRLESTLPDGSEIHNVRILRNCPYYLMLFNAEGEFVTGFDADML